MAHILPILVVVSLNVVGQLLIKQAMISTGAIQLQLETLPSTILYVFTRPLIIVGLILYASGAFLWMVILSRTALSLAYPMTSLSYIILTFLSWQLFNEPLTPLKLIGTIIIMIGVIVISRS